MALTQTQVSQLYVSTFGRASEGAGNKFWQNGQDMASTANEMLATTAAQNYFGSTLNDNQAFIEFIYQKTLNKTVAQDPDGIAYWVNALNNGMSKGQVVASLVEAVAQYATSTDPVTKAAYDQFNNRVEVSNYVADTIENADPNNLTKFVSYNDSVTSDASTVTAAKAEVDKSKPQTFTLTTGTDTFTLTNSDDVVNGAINTLTANDRIVDDSTTDNDTLNVELLGGANVPSSVEIKNVENMNFTVLSGKATLDTTNYTGYKTITAQGTGELELDNLTNTGATYVMKGATGGLDLGFAGASVAGTDTVNVKLDATTKGTLTVDTLVENVVLTTANAAASLTNFVATGATTVSIKGGQGFTLGTPATGFATATTIDARDAGKASFTTSVTGSVAVLTGATDDTVTRAVELTASDLYNLGAGNDTLKLTAATASTNTTLAASFVGVDNVVLTAVSSAINMENADQAAALTFEGGTVVSAFNLASGSTVTSTKAAAAAVTVDFRDTVMGEATTIDLQKGATSVTVVNVKNATINYGDTSTGAIVLDETASGTEVTTDLTVNANAGTFTNGALTSSSELKNLTFNSKVNSGFATMAEVEKLETFTINATTGTFTAAAALTGAAKFDTLVANAGQAVTLNNITATNTAGITKVELNATGGAISTGTIQNSQAIKDVSITGSKDVTATFTSTAANIDKVVSTSTGNTNITITNNGTAGEAGTTVTLGNAGTGKTNTLSITGDQKQTVTGGTGVDAVTLVGKGQSTANLGAGNDTITVDSGSINNITLGAGKDAITIDQTATSGTTTAATLAEKHMIIQDFKGAASDKDTIAATALSAVDLTVGGLAGGVVGTTNGLVTNWGTAASTTLAQKITAVNAITDTTAGATIAFIHEGKTFLFTEGSAASTGIENNDTLIQLVGISASTGITVASNIITDIA